MLDRNLCRGAYLIVFYEAAEVCPIGPDRRVYFRREIS